MKILVLLALLLAALPALAGEVHVQVDGLACPFCAYGLEKKLKPLPGVTGVRIDYKEGWVQLTVADGKHLDDGAIRKAVRAAGFTPREIHRAAGGEAGHDHGGGKP